MIPTEKAPEIDSFITRIFGIDRTECIKSGRCVMCSRLVTGFNDALSQREYQISGMCQACQDRIYHAREEAFGYED